MLRLAGFSMIGISCSGLGVWYAWSLQQRMRQLQVMNHIMELLVSLLQYGKSTLPECCRQLASQAEEPYGQAFGRIYQELADNRGRSFAEVYEAVMGGTLRQLPLKEQDRQLFMRCVLEQGGGDGEAGVRLIRRYQEQLREQASRLEAESREKSRVAIGLGTLGGILLIIILL